MLRVRTQFAIPQMTMYNFCPKIVFQIIRIEKLIDRKSTKILISVRRTTESALLKPTLN